MQYGHWHSYFPLGLRERRAYCHPVWGDSGFEYRWRRFSFMDRLKGLISGETVIEQTTDLDMNIVQTIRRRDGSEYRRNMGR